MCAIRPRATKAMPIASIVIKIPPLWQPLTARREFAQSVVGTKHQLVQDGSYAYTGETCGRFGCQKFTDYLPFYELLGYSGPFTSDNLTYAGSSMESVITSHGNSHFDIDIYDTTTNWVWANSNVY